MLESATGLDTTLRTTRPLIPSDWPIIRVNRVVQTKFHYDDNAIDLCGGKFSYPCKTITSFERTEDERTGRELHLAPSRSYTFFKGTTRPELLGPLIWGPLMPLALIYSYVVFGKTRRHAGIKIY